MPIESADFIAELDANNPFDTDNPQEGAAQIRLTKKAVIQSFPNIDAAVTADTDDLNQLTGVVLTELMPTGSVLMWATDTPPNGWLICDGAAIAPGFAALIALVGVNTPDLRDVFIRGSGAVRMPLTTQIENVGAHDHQYNAWSDDVDLHLLFQVGVKNIVNTFNANSVTHANPAGENIPANTALMYIIKT